MGFITSEIEYSHLVADVDSNNCVQDFKGTTWYPDGMSVEDIYKQVIKEHPEHVIIFSSFKLDGYFVSHLIYIG
jgi:hypothetical protein